MNDILFTPIRLNELETLIQNSVERALKTIEGNKPEPDKMFTVLEVAKYLHLSVPSIYRHISQRSIPHKKIPGQKRVYFIKSEINDWISQSKRKTVEELAEEI